MNYLAHAFLSFGDNEILVGNMISDFVKGKKQFDYSPRIHNGIVLHRSIDNFTDEHAVTKKAKEFFKTAVGLYAGAFVDVAYDHFLAKDESQFPGDNLYNFSANIYHILNRYKADLPERFLYMLPYMERDNWLYNYRTITGIENSFKGLVRRAKYLNDVEQVFKSFKENYDGLQDCYNLFIPDVKDFARKQFESI